ncbi:uncharacterized protein LOC119574456 isoform X2 [Penaeus monodon]|uniref:uncharacterized protein LOC119574456 isoform X2 n=1 Tax=Penaeus monodon TaxID=6687 RepID=UPI0018A79704|nr:uncharacterized protein LOC119574456 isoform X2 [Penaeus monodon]
MAKESNTFRDHDVIRHADAGPSSVESRLVNGTRQAKGLTQNHIYETLKASKRDNCADKSNAQKSRLPISTQSAAMNVAVKLSRSQQSPRK